MIKFSISRSTVHDIKISIFASKRDGWYHISFPVDTENGYNKKVKEIWKGVKEMKFYVLGVLDERL